MHTCCERRTWTDPKAGPAARALRCKKYSLALLQRRPSFRWANRSNPKKDLAKLANIGSGSYSKDLIDFPKTSYF